MTLPDESNTNREILDELTEGLGDCHDSARALADCLQTRNVTRKKRPEYDRGSEVHVSHTLLGEASGDLERVTPQPRKSLHS